MMSILRKFAPLYNFTIFYLVVSIILRLILLLHPITQASFSLVDSLKIFTLGLLSDFFVFVIASGFLWLYLIFISNSKYLKPYGYIIFGLLVMLLLYVSFCNTILDEYGGDLPLVGIIFIGIKTILFGLLLFLPKYRSRIRFWLFTFVIFLYVVLILQNAMSEFFFWNEFGVRYNFIAVDYLVYTNEVIGNIMQSYPVIPLFSALLIISGLCTYLIVKKSKSYIEDIPTLTEKVKLSIIYFALFGLSLWAIPYLAEKENSQNIFANELQANGIYKFFLAFKNNELDYFKFYKTIPQSKADAILNQQFGNVISPPTLRQITASAAENHKNVVLITIESYSAEYMKAYGNDKNLTPFLDSLATKSLMFSNFYAVGNRTVRGLEAVTLCLPPTAGESVVKRHDNKNKFSTGNIFNQKGYNVKYMYGGDAFFDNMRDFYSGNGYEIVDKQSILPNEITIFAPSEDGIFVTTKAETFYLDGDTPTEMKLQKVDGTGGVKGTLSYVPGSVLREVLKLFYLSGNVPVWTSVTGINYGLPKGQLMNPIVDKFTLQEGSNGASIYDNSSGINRYITSMTT